MRIKIVFAILITAAQLYADVIITEIYQKTVGSYHYNQWVELYNTGSSNVDIAGWMFDNGEDENVAISSFNDSAKDDIKNAVTNSGYVLDSTVLKAGEHALVVDRGSDDSGKSLTDIDINALPNGITLLCTADSSLVGGSSISSSRCVILKNASGDVKDSYANPTEETNLDNYGAGSDALYGEIKGQSVERVLYNDGYTNGDDYNNWIYCAKAEGHSAGKSNSYHTMYAATGSVDKLIFNYVKTNTATNCIGEYYEYELYALDSAGKIVFDFNENLTLHFSEYLDITRMSADAVAHTTRDETIEIIMQHGRSGLFQVNAMIPGTYKLSVYDKDARDNDYADSRVEEESLRFLSVDEDASAYSGDIYINEIMFAGEKVPYSNGAYYLTDSDTEWIELYNMGSSSISITNFTLSKLSSSGSYYEYTISNESNTDMRIDAGGYMILTSDLFAFNKVYGNYLAADATNIQLLDMDGFSSESIVSLKDAEGKTIDTVNYNFSSSPITAARKGVMNSTNMMIEKDDFISIERQSYTYPRHSELMWAGAYHELGSIDYIDVEYNDGISTTNEYNITILATPGARYDAAEPSSDFEISMEQKNYLLSKSSPYGIDFTLNAEAGTIFDVKIFSKSGRFLGTYVKDMRAFSSGETLIHFDGSLGGRKLGKGLYFLYVSGVQLDKGKIDKTKVYFAITE